MTTIKLDIKINGNLYNISCKKEEKEYIESLVSKVDNRIDNLKRAIPTAGSISTLLAINSIKMEDEITKMERKIADIISANRRASVTMENEIWKRVDEIIKALVEKISAILDSISDEL